jgi:ribose-phosphate pyrophosphokinase
MLSLNLTNQETSDIHFKIYNFPDGQRQVKIESPVKALYSFKETPVTIMSRMNNFQDLELIICSVKSLRGLGFKELNLYCPLFLGSRSDRVFEPGTNNYLKDVICPIINSLEFESVIVVDPHSDVLEACLNNFKKISNLALVEFALKDFKDEDFTLVSPDAGALKKVFNIAEKIKYEGSILTCTKTRDEHGKLSNLNIPLNYEHVCKPIIIIDDICDGGATFARIGRAIYGYRVATGADSKTFGKVSLIITHGMFNNGFAELARYFNSMYTTNSYKNINKAFLTAHKIKQLDVF